MGADGSNPRQLSFNVFNDFNPCVMPDGRILYTRWEYVDRSQVEFHHLWTMNPDGTVANNVVRQVSAEGGDASAQQAAFDKARRAILRCQSGGFPLPADKYGQWQEI